MLCNVFNYTAYIFSENRSSSVNEISTEIQIVNPRFYIPKTDKFAFLIKSGDYYDGLVFLNNWIVYKSETRKILHAISYYILFVL